MLREIVAVTVTEGVRDAVILTEVVTLLVVRVGETDAQSELDDVTEGI